VIAGRFEWMCKRNRHPASGGNVDRLLGRATTIAVVVASIVVLMSDFFLTKLFLILPLGLK